MTVRRVKNWVLRAALLAAAQAALSTPAAAAAPALHVIPFPGTPDASPLSAIIFSSLRASELKSVIVTGSSSGGHAGRIVPLPAGGGTEFKLDHAFTAGEQVNVTAQLASPAAGTAEGDPGATSLQFSFTIATPATAPATGTARTAARPEWLGQLTGTSSPPAQSFRSDPGIHPPVISASANPDSKSGDIFLTENGQASGGGTENGLMILDPRGRLVWFRPVHGWAVNLEAQRYHGHPVLTWFQVTYGQSGGHEDVIMNRSYRTVATLHAGYGYRSDMHEFQLTPQGTALIDAYSPVRADLSSIGGPTNGAVLDCIVQEIDVRTGQVLWEWHSLGHVPLSATYSGHPKGWPPYEYFHLNSIQQLPNGNLLISARDTWSVYEISKQTGRVIWTLGGRYSNFKMGPGTNFEWQHDARLSGNTLSLFDDGAAPQEESQSSAKLLRLDTTHMRASLVRRYTHSPPVLSGILGSAQVLANHDVFVGWGAQPLFSEYTPAGKQIFAGSLPLGLRSYRAFRFPWFGRPSTRPSLAISREKGGVTLYVSWNGATQVSSWRVRGGAVPGALKALTTARRSGFQTTITVSRAPRYLAVQALNARGRVIGTSAPSRS